MNIFIDQIVDEQKNQWIQEAEKDGFDVVTDKFGDFNFE